MRKWFDIKEPREEIAAAELHQKPRGAKSRSRPPHHCDFIGVLVI